MKKTQKQKIIDKFRNEGFVSNFWAIDNYILRLASIISTLRQEGWDIRTEYKGKVGDKNCHYYLNTKPTRIIKSPIFNENGTVKLVDKKIELF